MKKVFLAALIMVVVLSSFTTEILANNDSVEISFCVGDDTLMINGKPVKVEKPYVVGEGVTLVPVRVITEAFEAKVDWINETRTVNITYPDVNIVLQIDNPVAEINGRAETLLAAPQLTGGSTMVPLRFISENFGADVSYEETTERITVTKELSISSGSIVEGIVDQKNVGDSYYGWSMEKPEDMQLETRYFDGTYTVFVYDDNNFIDISIYTIDEEYDFEDSFLHLKSLVQGYTLVKADKNTSNSKNKVMHIQAKDKTEFYDIYEVETDKYVYSVNGIFENEKAELKEKWLKALSTFQATFSADDIYDLSNVKDGVRRFKTEPMNLSFDVPHDFLMLSDEDAENSFCFISNLQDDDTSMLVAEIYSKDSVESAETLAKYDYERNKKYCNEKISKFDDGVTTNSYTNIDTYEYSYEINATDASSYARDAFFEIGEYVYNIHVTVKLPNDRKLEFVDSILNSVEAKEVDFSEVGTIMYNDADLEGTFISKDLNKCTMEFPKRFQKIEASKSAIIYSSGSVAFIGAVFTDEEYTYNKVKTIAKEYETSKKKMDGSTIVQTTTDITLGKNKFAKMCYKISEDGSTVYSEVYCTVSNGVAYVFEVAYQELAYSEYARNEVKSILTSINFK